MPDQVERDESAVGPKSCRRWCSIEPSHHRREAVGETVCLFRRSSFEPDDASRQRRVQHPSPRRSWPPTPCCGRRPPSSGVGTVTRQGGRAVAHDRSIEAGSAHEVGGAGSRLGGHGNESFERRADVPRERYRLRRSDGRFEPSGRLLQPGGDEGDEARVDSDDHTAERMSDAHARQRCGAVVQSENRKVVAGPRRGENVAGRGPATYRATDCVVTTTLAPVACGAQRPLGLLHRQPRSKRRDVASPWHHGRCRNPGRGSAHRRCARTSCSWIVAGDDGDLGAYRLGDGSRRSYRDRRRRVASACPRRQLGSR